MRRKIAIFGIAVLLVAALGLLLHKTDILYTSHTDVVNDTLVDLLERMDGTFPNPDQQIDLHEISSNPSPDAHLFQVADWSVEDVYLANTTSIGAAFMDDDPVYGLKANIQIVYADGRQATVSWESWRYGIVLGPVVLSKGDGPPGYVAAATWDH